MACEKEMSCCVRGYHVYKDMRAAAIGEVVVCKQGANQRGKIFVVKFIHVKIFSYVFLVRKYFHNEIKANYGIISTTCILDIIT